MNTTPALERQPANTAPRRQLVVTHNKVWRTFNSGVRQRFNLAAAAGCGLTLILLEANGVDKHKYKHMTHNPCYFHLEWNITTPPGVDCFNSASSACWLCSEGYYGT